MSSLANVGLYIGVGTALVTVGYIVARWRELQPQHRTFEILLVIAFVLAVGFSRYAAFLSDQTIASLTNHTSAQEKLLRLYNHQQLVDEAALRNAQKRVKNANQKITSLDKAESMLSEQVVRAISDEGEAMRLATRVQNQANIFAISTNKKLREAEQTASRAASKAGVFSFSSEALEQIASIVGSNSPGTAGISCSPNFEEACDQLTLAFRNARWEVNETRGASFFSGQSEHGIIVFYNYNRAHEGIALAQLFRSNSLDAVAFSKVGAVPEEISISLIFIASPKLR